jgi:hypothetical protein
MNNIEGELISTRKTYVDFFSSFSNWQIKCHNIDPQCSKDLSAIYKQLRVNQIQLLGISELLVTDLTSAPDDYLKSKSKLIELSDIIFQMLHKLELLSMANTPQYFLNNQDRQDLYYLAHKSSLIYDTLICRFVDSTLRTDFELIWTNFFLPLEKFVLNQNNTDYLINELSPLNMLWNTFHLKMSKGHKPAAENIGPGLTNIQNRWNSILKLYLLDNDSSKTNE